MLITQSTDIFNSKLVFILRVIKRLCVDLENIM